MARGRPRGRPPRISLEQVLDAAASLGSSLSMRAVARELGVGVSSLYYYVQSREELVTLVAERVMEQLRLELDHPRNWRPGVLRSGYALRLLFAQRAVMAENAQRDPRWGDTIVALHEEACAHLVRAGFSPGRAFLAVRAVADLVEAHTVREHHHRRGGKTDLELAAGSYGRHPVLDRAFRELGPDFSDQRFDFALRSLVRGMTPA